MPDDTTKQGVLFKSLCKKAVIAKFDQDHASSDGGAVLLKACDEKLKVSTTLASCLSDGRQQSKVTHSLEALFQQRLFAIACGYADGSDASRLADDPVMKLVAGRDPVSGGSLASQPTLSRFERGSGSGPAAMVQEPASGSGPVQNFRYVAVVDRLFGKVGERLDFHLLFRRELLGSFLVHL